MKLDNRAIGLIKYLRKTNPKFWTQKRLANEFGVSEVTIKYHTNPETKRKRIEYSKKRRNTPEYKKYFREYYMNRYHTDPEFKRKHMARVIKREKERYRTDPEFRKRVIKQKIDWQRRNPEKVKATQKGWYKKLKADPVKYRKYRLKRKEYYLKLVKSEQKL